MAEGDGPETPRDAPKSPQQSVLVQPDDPPAIFLPSETVDNLADGKARALVLHSTPIEET